VILLSSVLLARGVAFGQNTPQIVASANDFLAALDRSQPSRVLFDFNDEKQRMGEQHRSSGVTMELGR
jgi:hypothetical protein